ncbi:hypothetical protein C8J57DRAFT_1501209 [Mycena rebaudengoi]|nr:hypothetical protein C8J57DRAFT_1501209 [Mycena rebaudengoi]
MPSRAASTEFVRERARTRPRQVRSKQKNSHEDASADHKFRFSRRIRLSIIQGLHRYGASAISIYKDIVAMMTRPRGQAAETCPPHRIPTAEQIQNTMTSERNWTRLHVNPCRATNFMVNNNPHDIYYYQPHDFGEKDHKSKFTVAITDDFSLNSTIANTAGPNGCILMDTTHRFQN